jgi:hypothetical protein
MNRQRSESGGECTLDHDVATMEAHVQTRLHGQVRDFRLLAQGGRLVLRGHARTYYAKQLAQQAVMEATDVPIAANEIQVV